MLGLENLSTLIGLGLDFVAVPAPNRSVLTSGGDRRPSPAVCFVFSVDRLRLSPDDTMSFLGRPLGKSMLSLNFEVKLDLTCRIGRGGERSPLLSSLPDVCGPVARRDGSKAFHQ